MKLARVFALIIFVLGLFGRAPGAQAAPLSSKTVSPGGFLNPDGSLDLGAGLNGTLDLSGYNVQLDPQRGPVLDPASATLQSPVAALGNWAAIGDGGGVLDDRVESIAVHGTDVYVVGSFTDAANDPAADFVAKWDGTAWSALGSDGSGNGAVNAYLHAVALDASGNVYVGGDFSSVYDGSTQLTAAGHIAMWDGTHWHALGGNGSGGSSLNLSVEGIAVDSGGNVYAGGFFTNVNNGGAVLSAADYIAKWDGSNWSALGGNGSGDGSLNNGVHAIAVDGSGNVYAGGYFTDVNNGGSVLSAADYIAKWDGSNWSALGNNGSGNGSLSYNVYAISLDGGNLYAGGQFFYVYDGSTTPLPGGRYVAKWDGSHWSALGSDGVSGGSLNGIVYSVLPDGSGNVYVGGSFTNANNNGTGLPAADYVARWDGTNWSALGNNGAGNGAIPSKSEPNIWALALVSGDLFVGGGFYDVSNNGTLLPQADYLSRWDGTHWSAVGTAANGALATGYLSSEVNAIAVSGSNVYVGGYFLNVSNHGVNIPEADYIARWNGSNWSALGGDGAGEGALNSAVNALAVDASGKLYVGGGFTDVNNNGTDLPQAKYIAEWDGTNWSALGSDGAGGGSLNAPVSALAVDGAGNVYAGGNFTNVNNNGTVLTAADFISRWNGSGWSALGDNGAGGGSLNAWVAAIAVSGANVYVGGGFTDVMNGSTQLTAADYVAKWDGSNWSALGGDGQATPNGSMDFDVDAIAVSGTNVYVGGSFQNVYDGSTVPLPGASYVAQWNGTHWSGLGAGCGGSSLDSRVNAITVDVTGVYVGGYFSDVSDGCTSLTAADRVARWDGAHWHALGSNGVPGNGSIESSSYYSVVQSLLVNGSDLLVGGSFANVNNGGTVLPSADYLAAYGMRTTVTLKSQAANDGWVLETGESTNAGGTVDITHELRLGDDASRKQYRSILSFATGSPLPDAAIIVNVVLRAKRLSVAPAGSNPASLLQGFMVDIKKGYFGTAAPLKSSDFQAATGKSAGLSSTFSSGWYRFDLTSLRTYVNKLAASGGVTQIRLRFKLDDNNNPTANYLSLYSGNAASAIQPQLIITYMRP
ncbi:MAG TPA: hypothetical protein VMJ64_07750 [Anaerolineales bacterium]|nr:hypothetical protein [Anaerolineales bacterium]